jgi:hypothetical protein
MIGSLGSQSAIKIAAVEEAAKMLEEEFGKIVFKPAPVPSDVSEQPTNWLGFDDTPLGRANRVSHAQQLYPYADFSIAIENGQMLKANFWVYGGPPQMFDEPMLRIIDKYGQITDDHYTTEEMAVDGIAPTRFPMEYVWEAWMRNTGDKEDTTTAQVMQEHELVENHKDPSIDLAGVEREVILTNLAVRGLREGLYKLRAMQEFEKNFEHFESFLNLSIDDVEALSPKHLQNRAEREPQERMLIAMQEFERASENLKSLLD